jgi:hypothetical protein
MDEIQTSVVTPPLDLHWDQKHVPAWNVNYKVGISPASKKVSPRTCFRYHLQDTQPAHPGANRPSLCWNWGMFVHVFFIDGHFLQNPNPTNRVKLS